jgi:outer membrane protein OmpA-like peptidoglycan-associated protein
MLALVLMAAISTAQDVRTTLFAEADAAFGEARQQRLHLLSPDNYAEAVERYREADEDFKAGGNLERIRADLTEARALLDEAANVGRIVGVRFTDLLEAREDARGALAQELASDSWEDAARDFDDAMRYVERGDMKRAEREAARAESEYREAELIAIKRSLLGQARADLAEADEARADRYARATFQEARQLLLRAEQAIELDRYDATTASDLASRAAYEARHAIYISGVTRKIRSDDRAIEKLILDIEGGLDQIAQNIGTPVGFDVGLGQVLITLADSAAAQTSELRTARERLADSETQVAELESRLGVVSESREDLARRQQAFRSVSQQFTSDEAQVIRDGDRLIIRLISLNFPSGDAVIQPRNFALLSKLQSVLEDFPGSRFIVEGHTDSRGTEENNQSLSDRRAVAVRQYLLSNMRGQRPAVEAIGYGETSPVANNETEAGRAQNRRIDIVIVPEWSRVRLAGE